MEMVKALSAYDWIAALVVLLSMGIGLLRGVIKEIASLVSWTGAFLAAHQFSEPLARHFETSIQNGALRLILAFITVFAATLVVLGLSGQLLAQTARKVGLGPYDRLFGATFGVVRGLLVLVLLVMLASSLGINEQRDWKQALSTGPLERLAAIALPWLPAGLVSRVHLHAGAAVPWPVRREGD